MSEFVYVLENHSMPGLVKIGRTERSVSERVVELSSHTGVPTGFVVAKEYVVENSVEAERLVHERLADCRISNNREFFKIEAENAIAIIDALLNFGIPEKPRDYEREDELISRGYEIVTKHGIARPRMLEEMLNITYEEALFVIKSLQGRGLISERMASQIKEDRNPRINSRSSHGADVPASTVIRYQLPPFALLHTPNPDLEPLEWKEELFIKARLIQRTLAKKEIEVVLGDIHKGPAVTRFEIHAAPKVRLDDISAMSEDLAAALESAPITILAPIPGKSAVGIDVPNATKGKISMCELLGNETWLSTRQRLPVALGKDVYGRIVLSDLAEMPHLLIGGATGSGKSVCLSAIIISFLYRFSPNQIRFVMIDTKGAELAGYNTLPHLIMPIISELKKSILALRWMVNELEKRFQIFGIVGATDIVSYNSRSSGRDIQIATDIVIPAKLSYVVLIIENVEDLLVGGGTDAQTSLERLMQNGRVAGIHVILTTRHANQNVFSDSLRAELRARIAFKCNSRIESGSILGETGAERLSGGGDMLFHAPENSNVVRVQGAFVSELEIQRIVNFIGQQAPPGYETEIERALQKSDSDEEGHREDEKLIELCVETIRIEGVATASMLERRLRLGYARAMMILDELERRRVVGPRKWDGPRDVLIECYKKSAVTTVPPAPVKEPSASEQCLAVCACENCQGKIEFDPKELEDRESVTVPCPHCGTGIKIVKPS